MRVTLEIEDATPCTWDAIKAAIKTLTELAGQEYDDALMMGDDIDIRNTLTVEPLAYTIEPLTISELKALKDIQ